MRIPVTWLRKIRFPMKRVIAVTDAAKRPGRLAKALLCGFLLGAGAATVGSALTCPYPERDVERIFRSHDERPGNYLMALGTLTPKGPVPAFDEGSQSRASFTATFEGHLATPAGYDRHARFDVTILSSCLDDNCGGLPSGPEPALVFIAEQDGTFSFRTDVCNGGFLIAPTSEELARALACFDGPCESES